MSQKVPDTRRLFITSRSMVTTFSAEFIILACDTSTSRLSPVLTTLYLRLVFVLSFMKFHFTMQCNASEFQSVYLTGPRAILYNVYTFVAYFIWPSWRAQFRSIEVTNTFEDSERNLCHFWSPLSFIFKKAVFVFVYKIYQKKLLLLIFCHLNFWNAAFSAQLQFCSTIFPQLHSRMETCYVKTISVLMKHLHKW